MPKGGTSIGKHPLLTRGDVIAGQLFVRVLEDVVQPINLSRRGGRQRAPMPKHLLLANRGFPVAERKQIVAGQQSVAKAAIQQLLVDFYAAFPKRVRDGAREYLLLRSIVEDNWEEFPELNPEHPMAMNGTQVALESTLPKSAVESKFLFELGDKRTGYMWASLVEKYLAVKFWFKSEYGLTDDHLERIKQGDLGVPVSVHRILMLKVQERLKNATDPVIPMAFDRLMQHTASQPVKDGSFVFDQTEIPEIDWLKGQ